MSVVTPEQYCYWQLRSADWARVALQNLKPDSQTDHISTERNSDGNPDADTAVHAHASNQLFQLQLLSPFEWRTHWQFSESHCNCSSCEEFLVLNDDCQSYAT
ncbi:TPA: hypothetical protein ACH3X1_006234 [Trebouxia sp. C0004]